MSSFESEVRKRLESRGSIELESRSDWIGEAEDRILDAAISLAADYLGRKGLTGDVTEEVVRVLGESVKGRYEDGYMIWLSQVIRLRDEMRAERAKR